MGRGPQFLFVHNPRSRRGRAAAAEARAHLSRAGREDGSRWLSIEDLDGLSPEPAPARAVAVGGDGTVNAVARWLLEAGAGGTALAIVPGGTGNNLARALRIPLATSRALELAVRGGTEKRIDAIRYRALDPEAARPGEPTTRLIIQGGAWGFPAEIGQRYASLRENRLFRWLSYPLGGLTYRLLALAGLGRERRRPPSERLCLRASLPEGGLEAQVLAVFVGNEPTLGGGFRPCPRAALDDGRLDLCFIRGGSGRSYLRLFREVARGEHLRFTDAVEYRQSRGPADLSFDRPAPLLADGDVWMAARGYRLELLPAAIPVVVGF